MPLRTFFTKKTSSSSSAPTTGQSFATKSQLSLHLDPSLTPESPTSAEYVDVASSFANTPSSPNGRSSLHPNHAHQAHPSPSPRKSSSVYPSIANSSSPPGPASSSRLRLFGRKKDRSGQSVKSSTEEDSVSSLPLPPSLSRPSFAGTISDSDIPNLAPPKLGMALGGGASTRSLPNTNPGRPELRPLNTVPTSKPLPLIDDANLTVSPTSIVTEAANLSHGAEREKEKKKSLFSWSKSESKASADKIKKGGAKGKERSDSNGLTPEESFNLKSFRHVQPSPSTSTSPTSSPNPSSNSPYTNTQSIYSMSQGSQQQLRSPNASASLLPPPSLNHPTARPRNASSDSQAQRISVAAFREAQARRSMAGSPVLDGRASPGPGMAPGMRSRSQVNLNSRRFSQTFSSEDESSEEEEEEDSDNEGAGLSRKRTVTNRTYSGARSESGHGARSQLSQPVRGKTKSEAGHGSRVAAPSVQRPNPAIPLPSQAPQRTQASAATNDSDSDEDNTPLATLLPPRRPGSALSSRSNSSLNGRVPPSSFTPPPQERARTMSTLSSYNQNPPNSQSSNATTEPFSYPTSNHSQDSSATSRRPPPLIDINKLTGPNRAPLKSGNGDGASSPTKSKEGFTGGDTLLSGGNGRKRTRSPEKRRQGATSPTMSMYSTSAPSNKKFVSPPGSPVGSVFSLSASSAMGGGKPVSKRQETVMSDTSSVGSGSAASGSGQRRDVISERLKGVVQRKAGGAPSPVSTSAPPLPVSAKVPTPQPSRSHLRSPAAFEDSDSDEDEEEEEEDESDDEARYGAAHSTIKGRQQPTVRAAASSPSLSPVPPAQRPSPSPSPAPSSQRQALSRSPVPQTSTPPPQSASSTSTSFSSQPAKNTPRRPQPVTIQTRPESISPEPDVDLADVLGGGIRLISFDDGDGAAFPPSPVDPRDLIQAKEVAEPQKETSAPAILPPIVVRERERTPAFSVTSRPRHKPSASVSGVLSLGGSTTTMEQGKEGDQTGNGVTTSAIASQWSSSAASSTTTTMTTGGRVRSSSIGSLPLLSSAMLTNTVTTTTSATKPPVLQIPPPRTSSLSPESKASMSSFEEPLSKQSRVQPPPREKSRGFGLLSSSKSSPGLGSNASAASGSSSLSGGSSAVDSSSSSSSRPQRQQPPPLEKEKPRASKHSRVASAGGMSNASGATMRPQAYPIQSQTPPSGGSSSSSQMSRPQATPAMKPFSGLPPAMSRGSPATSSTGGSSSGRAPVTPRDGSELGMRGGRRDEHQPKGQWSGGASGLGLGHGRKRSVGFDDEDIDGTVRGKTKEEGDEESRRRDRRRSEAKAAIELGNVINGKGPIVDDDDEDLPIGGQYPNANNRMNMNMNMMNPMMMMPPNGGFPAPFGWAPTGGPQLQLPSPSQFMVPPPTDPSFFSAHQQAMMFAKQAYQMAVAQQAMAAAAEEWERGSAVGFSSSQSMYGGFGPAATGSVYGGFGGGNGWSTGSVVFPQGGSRTSGYGGFSGAKSEYGGGGGRGGTSVYGGSSYGPQERARTQSTANPGNRTSSYSRDSMMFNVPPVPPIPQQKTGPAGRSGGPPTSGSRNRTVSQPASPANNRNARPGKVPPPSSWKPGM